MTIVFLLDVYYCVIVAWTFFYLASCFLSFPTLPWESCGKINRVNLTDIFVISVRIMLWLISDNWWNTKNCSKPNGGNVTRDSLSMETIKRLFNTSLTLDDNLESWNQMCLNDSLTVQDTLLKNDSQLSTFFYAMKYMSGNDSSKNFTDIMETNGSSVIVTGKNDDFLKQLRRNCFNVTTVTPAEEYWVYVKFD